jgi:nucleoid-associated protein YgaU
MVRPVSPVVPATNYPVVSQSNDNHALIDNTTPLAEPPAPTQPAEDHGADLPIQERTLANLAERNGEPLVPANVDGTPQIVNPSAITPTAVSGPKQYKAQAGDTVSGMASKFLGSGSPANIQAIIDANPSLQDDPDKVIMGQTYVIPGREQASANSSPSNPSVMPPVARSTPDGEYFYTVQEGDSLWQIANDQLGDPSAVDALKELNAAILKGKNHDVVTPGMKLRLPAKPVASAAN